MYSGFACLSQPALYNVQVRHAKKETHTELRTDVVIVVIVVKEIRVCTHVVSVDHEETNAKLVTNRDYNRHHNCANASERFYASPWQEHAEVASKWCSTAASASSTRLSVAK